MRELDDIIKVAVEDYQCPGCVCGSDIRCYENSKEDSEIGCDKHVAGTMLMGVGKFFLGMPTGFCRKGPVESLGINIFKSFSEGWGYTKFNIPAWKYLDSNGNTLVRGLSPRTNFPFLHIFLENCMDKIDCLEITEADLEEMD